MTAATAAASAASARSSGARRGVAWIGAFVLLVLLATAGLPAGHDRAAAAHAIEVVETHAVRAPLLGAAADDGAAAARAVAAAPRQVPRTRRVSTRGLPPARAPTA